MLTWKKAQLLRLSGQSKQINFTIDQHFLQVIGDKKGGLTSSLLTNPKKTEILVEIGKIVQVPMKFIHVIRNPFDNIATVMLRATGSRNSVRKEDAAKVREGDRITDGVWKVE